MGLMEVVVVVAGTGLMVEAALMERAEGLVV